MRSQVAQTAGLPANSGRGSVTVRASGWQALIGGIALAAITVVTAHGEPSSAVQVFHLANDQVLVVSPDGKVTQVHVASPEMQQEIMKTAKPMSGGTILMSHGDAIFSVPDHMMDDGNMLSEKIARSLGN